jgi:hypothetical protein
MPPSDLNPNQRNAHEIQQQQPGWMVLYGTYSHEYVAFPLFPAPPETILTAAYPPALLARIQQTERWLHGNTRHRGKP